MIRNQTYGIEVNLSSFITTNLQSHDSNYYLRSESDSDHADNFNDYFIQPTLICLINCTTYHTDTDTDTDTHIRYSISNHMCNAKHPCLPHYCSASERFVVYVIEYTY